MMLEHVYDFLVAFLPELDPDHILQGYNTRTVLPRTEDFCIISMGDIGRVGTNVSNYTDEAACLSTLHQYTVLVDFISTDREAAQRRAFSLETVSRSLEGQAFLDRFRIYMNYADGAEYLPYVYTDDSYTHRFRVTLHLTRWDTVTISTQTANKADPKVVNVDTYK